MLKAILKNPSQHEIVLGARVPWDGSFRLNKMVIPILTAALLMLSLHVSQDKRTTTTTTTKPFVPSISQDKRKTMKMNVTTRMFFSQFRFYCLTENICKIALDAKT